MTALTQPRSPSRPPRDGLVRSLRPGVGVRSEDGNDTPTLYGHFAVFNRWTEIDSWFEGNFMERIAPGAFKKTFKEQGSRIRCLLQHGRDPQIGDKPIGKISVLREDGEGGYYEVELFDGLDDLVLDGLREDQYGASFRFRVMREEFVEEPEASEYNPKGIPERTLKEMQVFEFGPVTFGAYQEATAAVRSLTDSYFFGRLAATPPDELRALFSQAHELVPADRNLEVVVEDEEVDETVTDDTRAQDGTVSDESESDEAVTEEAPEAEAASEDRNDDDSTEEQDVEPRSLTQLRTSYSAVPSVRLTPLNMTLPRSRKRGNSWELPEAPPRRPLPPGA